MTTTPNLEHAELIRPATKPRPTLVPARGLLAVAQLLAEHQDDHGDRWTERNPAHHVDAAMRHILRWVSGDTRDDDSGHSHLTHAAARMLMAADRAIAGDRP